jgi:hypothetical protein
LAKDERISSSSWVHMIVCMWWEKQEKEEEEGELMLFVLSAKCHNENNSFNAILLTFLCSLFIFCFDRVWYTSLIAIK